MLQGYALLLEKEEQARKGQWVEKRKCMRDQKCQNKAPAGNMEQRAQQQKRNWGWRSVINKGPKHLILPVQSSSSPHSPCLS